MGKAFRILLVLGLVPVFGVMTAGAAPNRGVVVVGVFVGPTERTVSAGDTIILRQGWIAMNGGLVRMYLRQSDTNFTLSDAQGAVLLAVGPDEAATYWGPLAPRPDFPECRGDDEMGARWDYPLPTLEPGDYALDFYVVHPAPLTDGCDGDGDRAPDFYPAEAHRHIVIHVLP